MINFSYMMRLKIFRLVISPNILRHGKKSQQIVISYRQWKMELKWFFLQPQFVIFTLISSKQDFDIIQAEICKLLYKGVIIPTEREDDDFVSKLLTTKKRDDFLLLPQCKLESWAYLKINYSMLFFGSVGLKDAYMKIFKNI